MLDKVNKTEKLTNKRYEIGIPWRKNERIAKNDRLKGHTLSPEEGKEAKVKCVKVVQAESFPNGEKDKTLIKLYPKKDSEGLLRVKGRLQFANDLPYDAKHSILFTKDHAMTRLHKKLGHKINDVHKKLGHGLVLNIF